MELSQTYSQHKDAFNKELKYNNLKDKCARLQAELDLSQAAVREERRKNADLVAENLKLRKRLARKGSDSSDGEAETLRREIALLKEAFAQSEGIREQQKALIKQLRAREAAGKENSRPKSKK